MLRKCFLALFRRECEYLAVERVLIVPDFGFATGGGAAGGELRDMVVSV